MSTHDRGTFGQLLAEAKRCGANGIRFEVDLLAEDEESRWMCGSLDRWRCDVVESRRGRTGEEALRRLVEELGGRV